MVPHFLPLLTFLLSLTLASLPVAGKGLPHFKRAEVASEFKLYAYGTGIKGLEVFYGDGYAYISDRSNIMKDTKINQKMNITFTPKSNDNTSWQVKGKSQNESSSPLFYIVPTPGSFEPVGFADSSNHTLPEEAVTSGFGFFGHSLVYNDGGDILMQFWAQTTDEEGVWILKWNSDGTSQANAVPVTLKDTAPVKQTNKGNGRN